MQRHPVPDDRVNRQAGRRLRCRLVRLLHGEDAPSDRNGPGPRSTTVRRNAELDDAEAQLKKEREVLAKKAEKLKTFKPGTPDFKALEEEIIKAESDWKLRVNRQKGEFAERDANNFLKAYQDLQAQVKAYAETVIAAIRQHDPDNIVIVGSPEWDQRVDLVAADPITSDVNVVYSLHFYAGTHGGWLRDRASSVLEAGIPLIVSESSGSEASGMGANNYTEWQAWFDLMEANHVSWINYSVSDKAGETISVLEPGAPSNGGWDATQLTETGEYIRGVFQSHCD